VAGGVPADVASGARVPDGAALAPLDALATVRERCGNIARYVEAGRSAHLALDRAALDRAVEATIAATRARYPVRDVPPHSRWRHFDAGGVARVAALEALLAGRTRDDAARARFDLTVLSVLLDAGAGAAWRYREPATGVLLARSEGLAVATLNAFVAGRFSAHRDDRLRVDAAALAAVDAALVACVFQADVANAIVGLEGRAAMLRRLGEALTSTGAERPAAWFDALTAHGRRKALGAQALFHTLRGGLRHVLPGGLVRDGVPLGDCWPHPAAGGAGANASLVPFHKLTQWLAYSLVEPLQWAGVAVDGQEALTGLPEYRNGGLLLDTGVLRLRDPSAGQRTHAVGSELVVEWRALTVTLLAELVPRVRGALAQPSLSLAAMLEGGTWAAGRAVAAGLRDGAPPLAVDSDGTVF
jgi:hypothetical protein